MCKPINPEDLVIHVLNVGFGDNILIEFPADNSGNRKYGLVDCKNSEKTKQYLCKLTQDSSEKRLAFICATHPHGDHIMGINSILKDDEYSPREFWDSGFRHNSVTYQEILKTILKKKIKFVRVSSGMEWYFGKVRVTALAPSVSIRNRYATYGVDMNNASIVLRLEHHSEDVLLMVSREYEGNTSVEAERQAGRSVVILAGDAEFDSWANISQEYPKCERTSTHNPLIKKMVNHLSCSVVKVSHHGSMHSAPLDIYEKMMPELAIVSTEQKKSEKKSSAQKLKRGLFPHKSTTLALEECGAQILTTDGSYESDKKKEAKYSCPGTIVVVVPPGGKYRFRKLDDEKDKVPEKIPQEI